MEKQQNYTAEDAAAAERIEAATWARQRRWILELGVIIFVVASAIYALSAGA